MVQLSKDTGGRLNAPNREAWLTTLVEALRPTLAAVGPLPDIRITCGFPSRGGLARKRLVVGQCWPATHSVAGRSEIFISPLIDDAFKVAHIVLHELLHAVVGCVHGHRGPFKRAATRIGFVGKPTSTVPGEALANHIWYRVLPELGPYPHVRIEHPEVRISFSEIPEKKEAGLKTRLIKAVCDDCGYVTRTTRKWLVHRGPPLCPCSCNPMTIERV
jgi:hypothetical protein